MRGVQPICGELLVQETRTMTAMCAATEDVGTSDEAIALTGILDALRWRYVLESFTRES
jgi:hypothetical protein